MVDEVQGIGRFWQPSWYDASKGGPATQENIQKQYLERKAAGNEPNFFQRRSAATKTASVGAIVGVLAWLVGAGKDSQGGKWSGYVLLLAGAVLGSIGKFMYGVSLGGVPPKDETNPPLKQEPQAPPEEESGPKHPHLKALQAQGKAKQAEAAQSQTETESKTEADAADEDIKWARENPDTVFAFGLTQNPNYKITDEDIKFARENPGTLFAFGLTQNPNYKITDTSSETDKPAG